jgi:hypothetical protein
MTTIEGPVHPVEPGGRDSARELARKRVQAKREFWSNLVAFVVVNTFLVGVWALTGAGYFWPAWVIAGWAVGLVLHGYEVFFRRPITEADVDRELRRGR